MSTGWIELRPNLAGRWFGGGGGMWVELCAGVCVRGGERVEVTTKGRMGG
jgi:hypothetical protein